MLDDPPSLALLQEGSVIAERYRVTRCLKLGGMGGVYRVLDMQNDRFRALKAMLPNTVDDADLRRRFEQEAVIAGRIRSDHVVAVTDSGVIQPDGVRFIVMELLDGNDLGAVTNQRGAFALDEVVELLGQVALGLDRIHAEGIVHRDLKPENIFLGRCDDGTPWVKILDFGIAKNVGGLATLATTRALGTPLYMAPEQLTGDATIDYRADLYSFAHVAYTLAVGTPYWHDEAARAPSAFAFCTLVLEGMKQSATERAQRHGVQLPPGFDSWFRRATAPRADDRFDSAGAQNDALVGALAGQVNTLAERPRLATKRKLQGLAAVALVLTSGGLLFSSTRSSPQASPAPPSTSAANDSAGATTSPSTASAALASSASNLDRPSAPPSAAAEASARPSRKDTVATQPPPQPAPTASSNPNPRPIPSRDPLDHL